MIPRTIHPSPHRRAFTLVELLVVITVISILATLVYGAVSAAQKSSQVGKTRTTIQKIHRIVHAPDGGVSDASGAGGGRPVPKSQGGRTRPIQRRDGIDANGTPRPLVGHNAPYESGELQFGRTEEPKYQTRQVFGDRSCFHLWTPLAMC